MKLLLVFLLPAMLCVEMLHATDPIAITGSWSERKIILSSTGGSDRVTAEDNMEGEEKVIAGSVSWVITTDSISMFEYPCAHYGTVSYRFTHDSLYMGDRTDPSAVVSLDGNFLVVTGVTAGERRYFIRDTFNTDTIALLKRNGVNQGCLTGKFKIFNPEYNSKDPGTVSEAVEMPKMIDISKIDAQALYSNRTITIRVNGKPQLFYVTSIAWNNYGGDYIKALNDGFGQKTVITLRPAEWWKGKEFSVSYAHQ
jgi:hypothetical protein